MIIRNNKINSIAFKNNKNEENVNGFVEKSLIEISKTLELPSDVRNYCEIKNKSLLKHVIDLKEEAIMPICKFLNGNRDEREIITCLWVIDKMLDEKVPKIEKIYPYISKYNQTKSPNIQTFLAGIYRKMQVPDAFGPLVSMLIKNSVEKEMQNYKYFDPNEEIGGAILEYIKNYSAKDLYCNIMPVNN